MQRERCAHRPARHRHSRDVANDRGVGRSCGRRGTARASCCGGGDGPVRRGSGSKAADDRRQLSVRRAGLHLLGVRGEDLAKLARCGGKHKGTEPGELDREQIAVGVGPASRVPSPDRARTSPSGRTMVCEGPVETRSDRRPSAAVYFVLGVQRTPAPTTIAVPPNVAGIVSVLVVARRRMPHLLRERVRGPRRASR